jgi:hypothetical protein
VRLITTEERDELLTGCRHEAVHLELRDSYAIASEAAQFAAFLESGRRDLDAEAPQRRYWTDLVRGLRQRGCRVRRARVVSEPVTDYIRYEWAGTGPIIEAGEEVRWLPRRQASTMALPGNDFWLIDDAAVVFTVFTGSGAVAERQLTSDAAAVQLCRAAFEAVWSAATPHSEYAPG